MARRGGGKSGGFRVLALVKAGEKAFFVLGFAKSDRDNIQEDELRALRRLADVYFSYDDDQLMRAIEAGELIEVGAQSKRAKK